MNNVDYEIDIKKMLYNILKKWRVICIVMCIFAVIGNFIYIYTKIIYKPDIEKKYEKSLTEEERSQVDNAYNVYESYNEYIEQEKTYLQNSTKMNIDYENVVKCNLQYSIETNDTNGVLDNISSRYIQGIKNDNLYKEIEKITNGDIDSRYVSELISIWKDTTNDGIENNRTTDVFNINVIANDSEQCKKIVSVLQDEINLIYDESRKIYGEYKITKVFENTITYADNELRDKKNEIKDEINSLNKKMLDATKSLSDKQKQYYDEKYAIEEKELESYISFKFIVLGLGIGFFITLLIYIFRYIFLKKLKTIEDMKLIWNIDVIDKAIVIKEKKYIDKILDEKLNKNNNVKSYKEQLEHLSMEIKLLVDSKNIKKILITGVANTKESNEIAQKIKNNIQSDSIKVFLSESIVDSTKALSTLSDIDSVIFIEEIMQSTYDDIDKEIQLCRRLDKNILGAVVVSD